MRAGMAIAVWLSIPGLAVAQSSSPAEEAFEKGRLFADRGHPDRACAAFELSQRLDPQFGTLFNLAGCYASIGKIATAWSLYRGLARSDSNAERRSRAVELAAELSTRVPTIQVRVPAEQRSPELRVFVGPIEVTWLLDVEIPCDAGRHVISASLPGYLPFRREIDLQSKASVDVMFEREPAPLSGGGVRANKTRSAGKITLAAGVGLVAIGLVAGWRWYVNDPDFHDTSSASSTRANEWAMISAFSLVSGVGATAFGGVLMIQSRKPREVRVAPAAGAGAVSLVVSGAF
jgi:hypothetical protein